MVEADEQEGGDRGQLPIDKQGNEVVSNNEAEHRPHEHQHEGVEAALILVPLHVAAGIKDDQRADARDEKGENEGQTIEPKGKGDIEGRDPLETESVNRPLRNFPHTPQEDEKSAERRKRQKPGRMGFEDGCQERRERGSQKWQDQSHIAELGDETGQFVHQRLIPSNGLRARDSPNTSITSFIETVPRRGKPFG